MTKPLNPMQSAHAAPRCTARSKRTGERCRAPAVRGWSVCRMDGARGGVPCGERNGAWQHGGCTKEAVAFRRAVNQLTRMAAETMSEADRVTESAHDQQT